MQKNPSQMVLTFLSDTGWIAGIVRILMMTIMKELLFIKLKRSSHLAGLIVFHEHGKLFINLCMPSKNIYLVFDMCQLQRWKITGTRDPTYDQLIIRD